MQLLDALQRLESLDRRFQARSRIVTSHKTETGGRRGDESTCLRNAGGADPNCFGDRQVWGGANERRRPDQLQRRRGLARDQSADSGAVRCRSTDSGTFAYRSAVSGRRFAFPDRNCGDGSTNTRSNHRRYRGSGKTHMSGKYVKTKYRGVFLRSGIAYIRFAVPGKKRGSVVWESTGQRNAQLAAERLRQRKTEIAEGRYFPNRRFEKALIQGACGILVGESWQKTNSKFEYRYPRILEHFKEYVARDITPEAIESFLNSLHQVEWMPDRGFGQIRPEGKAHESCKEASRDGCPAFGVQQESIPHDPIEHLLVQHQARAIRRQPGKSCSQRKGTGRPRLAHDARRIPPISCKVPGAR